MSAKRWNHDTKTQGDNENRKIEKNRPKGNPHIGVS